MLSNAKTHSDIPSEIKNPQRIKKGKIFKEDSSSESSKVELKNIQEVKNRKIVVLTKSKSNQIRAKNKYN